LLLPIDNYKILNFLNFNDIGANGINESVAFKRSRAFSKITRTDSIPLLQTFSSKYKNLTLAYTDDYVFSDSHLYGLRRQHNFISSKATSANFPTFFSFKNVNKLIDINFSKQIENFKSFDGNFFFNLFSSLTAASNNTLNNIRIHDIFEISFKNFNFKN